MQPRSRGAGVSGGSVTTAVLQVKVTCIPCSLPSGHPAGAPSGRLVRLRLVPFGPVAKIRKVLFELAAPKLKSASIRWLLSMTNLLA